MSTTAHGTLPLDATSFIQTVFQKWQQNDQPGAIALLKERVDTENEPWAVAFLVFLYMQQGVNSYTEAVPYAQRAYLHGSPWVATQLLANMLNNVAGTPYLLESALELASVLPIQSGGFDPIGIGWNLLTQGQSQAAVRVMSITTEIQPSASALDSVVGHAQAQLATLSKITRQVQEQGDAAAAASQELFASIENATNDIQTKAGQADLLLTGLHAEAAHTLFDEEAERNQRESRSAWTWGIAVLVGAAIFAILPIALHYLDKGPDYSAAGLLGVHAAASVALATIAGVLLTRARHRDQNHQRARDLSNAMGTMINYSNQIRDELERQRFLLTMGQLVLQAHLSGNAQVKDDSQNGLALLASTMRDASKLNA